MKSQAPRTVEENESSAKCETNGLKKEEERQREHTDQARNVSDYNSVSNCIKHPLKISNYWKLSGFSSCAVSLGEQSRIVFATLLGSWSLAPEIHFCGDTGVLQHGSLHRLAQKRRKWSTTQTAGRSRRVASVKGIADFAGTEQRSDHREDGVPQLLLTGWGETRSFGRNPKNSLVLKGSSNLAGMPSWILLMALVWHL